MLLSAATRKIAAVTARPIALMDLAMPMRMAGKRSRQPPSSSIMASAKPVVGDGWPIDAIHALVRTGTASLAMPPTCMNATGDRRFDEQVCAILDKKRSRFIEQEQAVCMANFSGIAPFLLRIWSTIPVSLFASPF
jgi:hypothetical protein